jgi:hypothetical protein
MFFIDANLLKNEVENMRGTGFWLTEVWRQGRGEGKIQFATIILPQSFSVNGFF